MISRVGRILQRYAERIVPDPFVLALGLTAFIFVAALTLRALAGASVAPTAWELSVEWLGGLGNPSGLAFALQMSLILVTGHALALSPPVQRLVAWIASVPRNAGAAVAIVALVACVAGIIHWGLGAIVGALLAREIGRAAQVRGMKLHYPLLGAAAYCGMAIWHGGLSGSAPLVIANEGHFASDITDAIPLGATVFSPYNLGLLVVLVLVLVLLSRAMLPPEHEWRDVPFRDDPPTPSAQESHRSDDAGLPSKNLTSQESLIHRLQNAPLTGRVIGTLFLVILATAITRGDVSVDLNAVNFAFLSLGIALQGSLRAYVGAIADGARGAGAIILQFPFYFGILAMMQAGGLVDWISELLVSLSSSVTFPLTAFLSAGIVNFFVPSGGGQWAVQADILLTAGEALDVPHALTVLAFSYGDSWSNLLQPFWALPLLGVMGLRARDIIGYTALLFLAMGGVVGVALIAASVLGVY